jgi:pilus assembly protein CpaF
VQISGGTGSGKTTLLNCLTNYVETDERGITCETPPNSSCSSPGAIS